MEQPYLLLDVFTDELFAGNQLAVFPQGGALDAATMQRIANELNIAESVFATQAPDESRPAKLRIFTPGREVPFAGHPTIGAAVAIADLLQWTTQSQFALEENVGDVPVRIERGAKRTKAWLMTPPMTLGARVDAAAAAAMLGLTANDLDERFLPRIAGAGSNFLYVGVRDACLVDAAQIDARALAALRGPYDVVGTMVFAIREGGTYVRMFAPEAGIVEDPATGSAAGPLYACLVDDGLLPARAGRFVSEQGAKMGRRSLLHVNIVSGDSLKYEVGGSVTPVGHGTIVLP